MEIPVSLPSERWGKFLELLHQKETELEERVERSEGLYKEVLLSEAAEFSDVYDLIEAEIKTRENYVIN